MGVIEQLKGKLIEERKKFIQMESEIRDEVCNEMAQQLVEMETECRFVLLSIVAKSGFDSIICTDSCQ